MNKPVIISIDDQREVLATLQKDLSELKTWFTMEYCESADEAAELMDEFDAEGTPIALLICDHVMPGKTGVDFMIDVKQDGRFKNTKKLLLTGQASHQDTITAINRAKIDRYIEKPWKIESLVLQTRELVTEFFMDAGLDYEDFLPILDQPTLYRKLR